ncbi:MAG: hypothetical protein V3W06_08390 [Acidimicrobiia bacterium]
MSRALMWFIALALTGCAVPSSTFTRPADLYNPPAEYPFYYDALWADLFWRCTTPEGGGVRVEGYAVSSTRSNTAVSNFEVQLLARDAEGNIVADRWTYGALLHASNVEPVPFAIAVPAAGGAVGYDLRYRFQAPDGGDMIGGAGPGHRRQEPRMVLADGLEIFGTIEDVCDAQYRRKSIPPQS